MIEATVIFAIITGAVTVISLAIRYMFLSKCNSGSCCWGCISFHRNTNQEIHNPQSVSQRDLDVTK